MHHHTSKPVALLVEPAPALARVLRKMLEALGLAVIEAGGADQALAIAEQQGESIAVLVSEFALADISGQTIRSFIAARNPRVAALYICDEADTSICQHRCTASALLPKPFSREDLESALLPLLSPADYPPAP